MSSDDLHEQLRDQLRNVHVYAATPFLADDIFKIDMSGMEANLDFLAESGVKVVGIAGGTGEVEALSDSELLAITKLALEVLGGRALVLPCLPENLSRSAGLMRSYEEMGVQVALAIPPLVRWHVPIDLQGVIDYFKALSSRGDLLLAPYNTQLWPVATFEGLAEVENVIAIKDPCQNPNEFFRAIKRLGDRFVWIGNKLHDPGVLQFRYQMGIEGFTSGQGNFLPRPELQMHEAARVQDWQRIVDLQESVAPLARIRSANDDAAMVKVGMDIVGLSGGPVRPPRKNMSAEDKLEVERAMAEMSTVAV